MTLHVVCVRVGDKYGPDYVQVLSDMLARNLSERDDAKMWCLTDDPDSLPDDVLPIVHNPELPGWWQKVYLFSKAMPWAIGDRVAYFDLDTVIVGRLEDLVQRKGIIEDWAWPGFNSSVMVWDHGEHAQVWDDFTPDVMTRPSEPLAAVLPAGEVNGGDQEWIHQAAPDFPLLPREWCVSYRWSGQGEPPPEAKVVCFHGAPKPHEVTDGWVPAIWKVGGLTQLPRNTDVNVDQAVIRANIRASLKRDLPWFTGRERHKEQAVLVCGGPSLADSLPDIRWRRRQGQTIISVNNTLSYLLENGVKPAAHVMLDARPDNAAFVAHAPEGIKYLIASQCDEAVFRALADRDVIVWHNMAEGLQDLFEEPALDMIRRAPGAKPLYLVPGGSTVGLRAVALAWMSGYAKIHVYGMDGCYRGDEHHAYPQALNDGVKPTEVRLGHDSKTYRCARWMVRQAEEFRDMHEQLTARGVSVFVHGEGLIPDMARALKRQAVAA